MDLGLRDRVYLVTGGTRGLGRASAETLVADGARVVVSGRDPDDLAETVAALGEASAVGVVADNADPTTPGRLVDTAIERWGHLDGALISVGGPPPGPVTRVTDEEWLAGFSSVFLGAVRIARSLADVVPAGGAIGFVLSSSVRQPVPNLAVSNGLRPGLAMVAKTLADELGPRGVRVFGLLPGRIATDRTRQLDDSTGDPEAARAATEATIPLGRYGEPEEFGRVAAFVLSPAASYVSGVMVPVDGGLLRAL